LKHLLMPIYYILYLLFATSINGQSFEKESSIQSLIWPVERQLHDRVYFLVLADHDPSTGGAQDFMCGNQFVYSGHRGSDITAMNFKDMDQGIAVLAAADGVVTFARSDQFDRNYWPPYIGNPNGVVIRHADGSNTQYWHMRKNSVAVNVGESVLAGQKIGMIGSSGATPIPHLHFEVWDNSSGSLQNRDPFSGPCNNVTSLWKENFEYPGFRHLKILDADVFTKTNLQGFESNNYFGEVALKDRPFRPLVYSAQQQKLGFWVLLQGLLGTQYEIEIFKPDSSSFSNLTNFVSTSRGIQWHVFYWDFSSQITSENYGWWRAVISYQGNVLKEVNFEVGESARFKPRFFPLSGRSFYVDGTVWQDTLRLSGLETEQINYSLQESAPSSVMLTDSIVTIGSTSDQQYRNHIFTVVASDNLGNTDTMYYHLIDFSKSAKLLTSIELGDAAGLPDEFLLKQNFPNPFNPSTSIEFSLSNASEVTLLIYNLLGEEVAHLIEGKMPGGYNRVTWDASSFPSGIYFYRLRAGEFVQTKKMVLLK